MLYPVMTSARLVSDLSGIWAFKTDDGTGFDAKWYEKPLDGAMTMPVPASYNDIKEGISFRDHYGWVFYQRSISVPAFVREKERVVLRCDAVTHHAVIYLNGEKICEHFGGFLPFEAEIGDKLHDGDNLLTIAVDNVIDYTTLPVGGETGMMSGMSLGGASMPGKKKQNNPNFDFFNYCGITRPVRIYTTPKTYIADVTLVSSVDDPCLDAPAAEISYRIDTAGPEKDTVPVKVERRVRASLRRPHRQGGRHPLLNQRQALLFQGLRQARGYLPERPRNEHGDVRQGHVPHEVAGCQQLPLQPLPLQ